MSRSSLFCQITSVSNCLILKAQFSNRILYCLVKNFDAIISLICCAIDDGALFGAHIKYLFDVNDRLLYSR